MQTEGLFIDHVIYGVTDIEAAADRLRREHGLGTVPGGAHRGGTTSLVVPLEPPLYLELLGVGDTTKADGAWLEDALGGTDRLLWWALGTPDLDATAARRGLPVQSGEMAMADGSAVSFRTAGMPLYPRPFFVAYDAAPQRRLDAWRALHRAARHECAPGGFAWVEVGDGPELIDAWLGDHGLPVRHAGVSAPGIRAAGIATAGGELVIR